MPQFSVSTEQGIIDGINYLLSGPSGLGQSFDGSYTSGLLTPQAPNMTQAETYITGNLGSTQLIDDLLVNPQTVDRYLDYLLPTDLYYPGISTLPAGITITGITAITNTVIEITFTPTVLANYTQTPFVNNQRVSITGASPTVYNGVYTVIAYDEPAEFGAPSFAVKLLSDTAKTFTTYTSGAVARVNSAFTDTQTQMIPTGAQAFVTVTGRDQRVFLSSQSNFDFYTYVKFDNIAAYQPIAYININRYRPITRTTQPDNTRGALGYPAGAVRIYRGFVWELDATVVRKPFLLEWDAIGSEVKVNQLGLQIFNNIIDSPEPDYYWYTLEIEIEAQRDAAPNDGCILPVGLRTQDTLSFAAQVVKQ
jgi:hypothetical protein